MFMPICRPTAKQNYLNSVSDDKAKSFSLVVLKQVTNLSSHVEVKKRIKTNKQNLHDTRKSAVELSKFCQTEFFAENHPHQMINDGSDMHGRSNYFHSFSEKENA